MVVTHGEYMHVVMASIERMLPEEWETFYADRRYKIRNCTILMYSRKDPKTGRLSRSISWRRMIYPDAPHESPDNGQWIKLPGKRLFTPAQLLAQTTD